MSDSEILMLNQVFHPKIVNVVGGDGTEVNYFTPEGSDNSNNVDSLMDVSDSPGTLFSFGLLIFYFLSN